MNPPEEKIRAATRKRKARSSNAASSASTDGGSAIGIPMRRRRSRSPIRHSIPRVDHPGLRDHIARVGIRVYAREAAPLDVPQLVRLPNEP